MEACGTVRSAGQRVRSARLCVCAASPRLLLLQCAPLRLAQGVRVHRRAVRTEPQACETARHAAARGRGALPESQGRRRKAGGGERRLLYML